MKTERNVDICMGLGSRFGLEYVARENYRFPQNLSRLHQCGANFYSFIITGYLLSCLVFWVRENKTEYRRLYGLIEPLRAGIYYRRKLSGVLLKISVLVNYTFDE